jgi:hypothetical protein
MHRDLIDNCERVVAGLQGLLSIGPGRHNCATGMAGPSIRDLHVHVSQADRKLVEAVACNGREIRGAQGRLIMTAVMIFVSDEMVDAPQGSGTSALLMPRVRVEHCTCTFPHNLFCISLGILDEQILDRDKISQAPT